MMRLDGLLSVSKPRTLQEKFASLVIRDPFVSFIVEKANVVLNAATRGMCMDLKWRFSFFFFFFFGKFKNCGLQFAVCMKLKRAEKVAPMKVGVTWILLGSVIW